VNKYLFNAVLLAKKYEKIRHKVAKEQLVFLKEIYTQLFLPAPLQSLAFNSRGSHLVIKNI
jgi:hypothetical protein